MLTEMPNVVLIVMDTARASAFSCYGNNWQTSPRIDRIAQQGVLYRSAVSSSPWTLPSHATLFTGEYASEHGCNRTTYELESGKRTLARVLRDSGYHTISVARNPMLSRQTGILQGFDEIYCLDQFFADVELVRDLVGDYESYSGLKKIACLLDRFRQGSYAKNVFNFAYHMMSGRSRRFRTGRYYQKRAGTINRLAKKSVARCADSGTPFFLFVNYMEHHLPYVPSHSYYRDWYTGRIPDIFLDTVKRELPLYNFGAKTLTADDRKRLWAAYHGATASIDDQVGDLHAYLDRQGLLENTMFVVVSDHGENLGEHGLLDHRYCLFDTLLKVPLVVQFPGREYAGTVVEDLVQLSDLFPSVMAVTGADDGLGAPPGRGFSLLPDAVVANPRPYALAEYLGVHKLVRAMTRGHDEITNQESRSADLKCLYRDSFKYIMSSTGEDSLYNLHLDPDEERPIDAPEVKRQMKAELLEQVGDFPANAAEPSRLEDAVAWKLKALGYM